MARYLLSVYQPDEGQPPPDVLGKIMAELETLREEMQTEGSWVFHAGLHPAASATVVRVEDDQVIMTDGPYTEGKEHLGGFSVIEAPDLDEALRWTERMARIITPLSIEVRPFQD